MSRRPIVCIALGSAGNRRPLFAAALAAHRAGDDVVCVTTPPWDTWLHGLGVPTRILSAQAAAYLSHAAQYPDIPESAARIGVVGSLQQHVAEFFGRDALHTELVRLLGDAAVVVCGVGYQRVSRVTVERGIPVLWVARGEVPTDVALLQEPVLIAASRYLVPGTTPVVPIHRVVGEWLLPEPADLPAQLTRFVRVNQPFVIVTHGAFNSPYAHTVVTLAVRCAHELGMRVLALMPSDQTVIQSDERTLVWHQPLAHQSIIAAAACVIHPGGAGTTQRVVRAGVPGLPIALHASDTLWAAHCFQVQLTPALLHAERVTRNSLSDAVAHCVTDLAFRYRARERATQMASEQGLEHFRAIVRPYLG